MLIAVFALLFQINPLDLLGGGGGQVATNEPGKVGTPADKVGDFSAAVLGSTEDVWSARFAAGDVPNAPKTYTHPQLVLFDGAVNSGCGGASASMGPFYCPLDQKLYLDTSFFTELSNRFGAPGDFAQAYVIAHEIGHHIQKLTGRSDQAMEAQKSMGKTQYNAYSVKMELQADCYAGVWGHDAQAKGQPRTRRSGRSAKGRHRDRRRYAAEGRTRPRGCRTASRTALPNNACAGSRRASTAAIPSNAIRSAPRASKAMRAALIALAAFCLAPSAHAEAGAELTEKGANADGASDVDARISACTSLLRMKPALASAYGQRGAAYAEKGDLNAALADLDRALSFRQSAPDLMTRASVLMAKNDIAAAIADTDKAAHARARRCAYSRGRGAGKRAVAGIELDVALTACNIARALAPDDPNSYDSRGLVFLKQARYPEAFADYDAAAKLVAGKKRSQRGEFPFWTGRRAAEARK